MTYLHEAKTGQGLAVTVEYDVTSHGSPTTYSPMNGAEGGDSPEIEVTAVWQRDSRSPVTLSDDDAARIEQEILEAHDFGSGDDDFYDPAEWSSW